MRSRSSILRLIGRSLLISAAVLLLLYGIAYAAFADVRYITQAAIAEAKILRARRPIAEVIADSTTDARTRGKLLLVLAARAFARDSLGLAVGETYTTYTQLERDTLVVVLSAAPNDKLAPYTWSYPVVGRVPYKGFFQLAPAQREAQHLQDAGMDTYLRPSAAFSTLGWFNDPLLSTVVRADSVDLAATIIHEVLHNTLFVKSQVDFNESFAEFIGYRGAEAFFRSRGDSVSARKAVARWHDVLRLGRFWNGLAARLDRIYAARVPRPQILQAKNLIFQDAAAQLAGPVARELETIDGRRLSERPMNNASLLAQRTYGTGLDRFDRMLERQGGDVAAVVRLVKRHVDAGGDPWAVLGPPIVAPRRPARHVDSLVDSLSEAPPADSVPGTR